MRLRKLHCASTSYVLPDIIEILLSFEESLLIWEHSWREYTLADVLSIVLDSLKRVFRVDGNLSLPNMSIIIFEHWVQNLSFA